MKAPQRIGLASQSADVLRQALLQREWTRQLPSERTLMDKLNVSRRTVRGALHILEKEGWLASCRGHRRRILEKSPSPSTLAKSQTVGVLWLASATIQSRTSLPLLRTLENRLHAAGYTLELHTPKSTTTTFAYKHWQNVIKNSRARCWLLNSTPPLLQRWLVDQQVPVILAGSAAPGIHLPAFDLDYRAICRHARQTLYRLGHRQLALLMPQTEYEGDRRSEDGFTQDAIADETSPTKVQVLRYQTTPASLIAKLELLWRSPTPPTALLIAPSLAALTTLTYLQQRGLKVPRDVSLLARDYDETFAHVVPALASYAVNLDQLARRITRALLQLAKGEQIPARETLLYPEFLKGQSLACPTLDQS